MYYFSYTTIGLKHPGVHLVKWLEFICVNFPTRIAAQIREDYFWSNFNNFFENNILFVCVQARMHTHASTHMHAISVCVWTLILEKGIGFPKVTGRCRELKLGLLKDQQMLPMTIISSWFQETVCVMLDIFY